MDKTQAALLLGINAVGLAATGYARIHSFDPLKMFIANTVSFGCSIAADCIEQKQTPALLLRKPVMLAAVAGHGLVYAGQTQAGVNLAGFKQLYGTFCAVGYLRVLGAAKEKPGVS